MARASNRATERTIRVVRPAGPEGLMVVRIDTGKESAHYVVREIVCEIGGRGFAVQRLGLGPMYHVRIGQPSECSCDCLGFLSRTACKHILGLLALEREGKL
jgi:hypothetical protein